MAEEVVMEERIDRLEALLGHFIVQTNTALGKLGREMLAFKSEMKDFKDEMKDFKDEARLERREMNKQWGALANKMGTIVEDIVVPAIRPVVKKYFGEDVLYLAVNVRKRDKKEDLRGEFDIIAVGESRVFLVETKSSPREGYLDDFQKNMERFRRLFPEYRALALIPIFASIRFEDSFIPLATARGMYLLAYRQWDYMDILNFDALDANPPAPLSHPPSD